MRNISLLLLAILSIGLFNACGLDTYNTVPAKTAGVLLEQPYYVFAPEDGGRIKPEVLTTGKRNLGNGSNNLYLVDLSVQEIDWNGDVLMVEKVNQNFSLTFTYQAIPDRVIDLVLNYICNEKMELPSANVTVDLNQIFAVNAFPVFDMVVRDQISKNSAMTISTNEVSAAIRQHTVEELGSIKIPRLTIDGQGNVYQAPDSIAITDVIEVLAVNLTNFKNPDVIDRQITLISNKRSELKEHEESLKQAQKRYDIAQTDAEYVRQSNYTIGQSLKDSKFRSYYTLNTIMDALKSEPGKNNNTRVYIVPSKSTVVINNK